MKFDNPGWSGSPGWQIEHQTGPNGNVGVKHHLEVEVSSCCLECESAGGVAAAASILGARKSAVSGDCVKSSLNAVFDSCEAVARGVLEFLSGI